MTARKGDGRIAYAYLAPALLVLVGLMGYPIYQLVLISLFDYGQEQGSGGAPRSRTGRGPKPPQVARPRVWWGGGGSVR
ncbi:hypothetical protein ACFXGA_02745, partial [Actinosynnema sp. NPDC059335]